MTWRLGDLVGALQARAGRTRMGRPEHAVGFPGLVLGGCAAGRGERVAAAPLDRVAGTRAVTVGGW
jgi:hypothetical protein